MECEDLVDEKCVRMQSDLVFHLLPSPMMCGGGGLCKVIDVSFDSRGGRIQQMLLLVSSAVVRVEQLSESWQAQKLTQELHHVN